MKVSNITVTPDPPVQGQGESICTRLVMRGCESPLRSTAGLRIPGHSCLAGCLTLVRCNFPLRIPAVAMVTASGMINEAVTGGNVVLDVLLDGIQLYTNNANTCGNTTIELPLGFGTITIDSLACPAASGSTQNLSISLILPSGIPSGDYTVLFNATDQNSGPLYCLNASFTE